MTAEELLKNSADGTLEYASFDDQDYCIIDPSTRVIDVPERYRKVIGVESDEKAERIRFKCPKIVGDNIDLSQLSIRINFRNANKDIDRSNAQNVVTEEDTITFDWLLSRNVTRYKGEVNFIVCAVKVNDDATITNEWNTAIAKATVLEGLEVDYWQQEEDQARDLLTELLDEIEKKGEEVKESIAAPSDEQVNNAVEKYFEENPGSIVAVDETLTKEGFAADAKVVGDKILNLHGIEVSETEPVNDNTEMWVNPNTEETFQVPEIKDEEISEVDTWSSKKINERFNNEIANIIKRFSVPKLTEEQKSAMKSLMDNYYSNRSLFFYEYNHNRDSFASDRCFDDGEQKFMLNCNTFVENIIMGRDISDYIGKNKETYSPVITKAFDFGYYPIFENHQKMYREAIRQDGEITGYYGFVKPNADSYKDSYSSNTYYSSKSSFLNNQLFNSFMNANDLALELCKMGCEIPLSEIDVGDILFSKHIGEDSNEESTFFHDRICWRKIAHTFLVYDKKKDGTLTFIEATGDTNTILKRSFSFPLAIDRVAFGYLLNNTVMCARLPIAFGYKSNVPDTITVLDAPVIS